MPASISSPRPDRDARRHRCLLDVAPHLGPGGRTDDLALVLHVGAGARHQPEVKAHRLRRLHQLDRGEVERELVGALGGGPGAREKVPVVRRAVEVRIDVDVDRPVQLDAAGQIDRPGNRWRAGAGQQRQHGEAARTARQREHEARHPASRAGDRVLARTGCILQRSGPRGPAGCSVDSVPVRDTRFVLLPGALAGCRETESFASIQSAAGLLTQAAVCHTAGGRWAGTDDASSSRRCSSSETHRAIPRPRRPRRSARGHSARRGDSRASSSAPLETASAAVGSCSTPLG